MELKDKISLVSGKIDDEYNLLACEVEEIKNMDTSLMNQLKNSFLLGYYKGNEFGSNNKNFFEIQECMNDLCGICSTIDLIHDGIIHSPNDFDYYRFDTGVYLVIKQLRENIESLNRLLGYSHD